MHFRLFTMVFIILFLTFTVRLGDVAWRFATNNMKDETVLSDAPRSVRNVAYAEEAAEEDADDASEEGDEKKEASEGEESGEAANNGALVIDVENNSDADPFLPKYSDAEIEVLESLAERREQLEERARQLDQRALLLQATERKIEEKMAEMNALRDELKDLLDEQQDLQEDRLKRLVKIYETMKPKDAASIFNELNFNVLLNVLDRMSERKSAPILAAMDPDRARLVSTRLAEQRALPTLE